MDKAVDIRRNILRSFNKVREDFEDLRGYNDYLEMVEDIIFNLCNGIDVAETERKVPGHYLTQFYSVDFSQSNIGVKRGVLNKRTIKVCVSCFVGVLGPPRLARHP